MSTIPASQIVAGNPDVLGAGGQSVDIIGLLLTNSTQPPLGTVQSFASAEAVGDYFGLSSPEKDLADIYFAGYEGATRSPGEILFAQYNSAAVAAYLRGGDVADMSLTDLKAISGTLIIAVDGYTRTAGALDLAAATGFSSAAALIETALNAGAGTLQAITAAMGGEFTGSITGTTMTITAVDHGEINVGDTITGAGVTDPTTVVAFIGGSGGAGTYEISPSQSVGSETLTAESNVLVVSAVASNTVAVGQSVDSSGTTAQITAQNSGTPGGIGEYEVNGDPQHIESESMNTVPTAVDVSFDTISGGFVVLSGVAGAASTMAFATGTTATALKLTSATGAVLSQGAAAADPDAFMTALVAIDATWSTFMTMFDPDETGFANKLEFATWNGQQNDQYTYVCWDTDIGPTQSSPDSGCLGAAIDAAEISGTVLIYGSTDDIGQNLAAFFEGAAASINFAATNGRITFAFRRQSGIAGDITTGQAAINLGGNPQVSGRGNGYNFYGAYGAGQEEFVWFQRGFVSGEFLWADSYINQIWLNRLLRLALLSLMEDANSIPFSVRGDAQIASAVQDAINTGLNFGAYEPGQMTSAQRVAVNQDAGRDIAQAIEAQGWYLLIRAADGTVRANRGPRQVTFYYLDRGSVQSINLTSVAIQ